MRLIEISAQTDEPGTYEFFAGEPEYMELPGFEGDEVDECDECGGPDGQHSEFCPAAEARTAAAS